MQRDFQTLQELIRSLEHLAQRQCLLWFEDDTAQSLTYAQFVALTRNLASGLTAAGIGPGDTIGIFAENSWQSIVLVAGILLSGAAVMPLDPQFSGSILEHTLNDAAPRLLFANEPQQQAVCDALGHCSVPVYCTDKDVGADSWRSLLCPGGPAPKTVRPEDRAALFYTSGTTGLPKGVPLTHANLVFQQRAIIRTGLVKDTDRILLPLPLHHVYPFVVGIFTPFSLGVSLILPQALVGAELVRAIKQGKATIVIGVPRLYEALYDGVISQINGLTWPAAPIVRTLVACSGLVRRRFNRYLGKTLLGALHNKIGPSLRIMASGGAPLDPKLAQNMEALGWKIAIGYGLTETAPILTVNPPGSGRLDTVGKALDGVRLRIEPAPRKEETPSAPETEAFGELWVQGPGVFQGYHNLPDLNASAFTDGWFRTGDLARLEDGWLVLNGRASTLIVTKNGENIQPEAVEHVLDTHPFVKESGVLDHEGSLAVLVIPDLVAVRESGRTPEEAIRLAVKEISAALPSYQRPSIVAVSSNRLERTRLGKIQRHLLASHFTHTLEGQTELQLGPIPLQEMQTADRRLLENDAARGAWELLAALFPKRRLTPDAELAVDMGVDSLEWLRLSMELSKTTGVELNEDRIASIVTVRDLLRICSQAEKTANDYVDPIESPEAYLDAATKQWLEPTRGARLVFYRLLHASVGRLIRLLFRLEIQGLEHLKGEENLVLTPNHTSYLDPVVLVAALPFDFLRNTNFAAWIGAAFANSFLSFFSRTAQAVPIDAVRKPAASMALGAAVLRRRRNLVWFPEGMRSRSGELLEFQPGLGRILARHPAYVVPVIIRGAYQALPPGRTYITPAKITIGIEKPMRTTDLAAQGNGNSQAEKIMSGLRVRMLQASNTPQQRENYSPST